MQEALDITPSIVSSCRNYTFLIRIQHGGYQIWRSLTTGKNPWGFYWLICDLYRVIM